MPVLPDSNQDIPWEYVGELIEQRAVAKWRRAAVFFNKRKPKDIPIDEFVFSPEDIFVLLGGFDPAMFACNIYTMNLSRIAEERPDREEWRRKMIKRFQPHGLVDEEGNPCPALAEALAPLRAREIVVTNGPERTRTIE
ncbi:MAG: hypothetical protein U0O24_04035, partial [Eggerthellaceae bacterium]